MTAADRAYERTMELIAVAARNGRMGDDLAEVYCRTTDPDGADLACTVAGSWRGAMHICHRNTKEGS